MMIMDNGISDSSHTQNINWTKILEYTLYAFDISDRGKIRSSGNRTRWVISRMKYNGSLRYVAEDSPGDREVLVRESMQVRGAARMVL